MKTVALLKEKHEFFANILSEYKVSIISDDESGTVFSSMSVESRHKSSDTRNFDYDEITYFKENGFNISHIKSDNDSLTVYFILS